MESVVVKIRSADIIGQTVKLLLDCKKNDQNQLLPSIYMVPSLFRDLSPSSFCPRVVSIGPLHHEDQNLKGFEVQKETFLHDLLDRLDSKPEKTLKTCVKKVTGSLDRIRSCYVGMQTYEDVDLARMMVLDGCFILNFIYHLRKKDRPLLKNMLITQSIIYDLLLIENQIPFFVLEDIFECTIMKLKPPSSVTKHIEVLLIYYNIFEAELVLDNEEEEHTHDHLLSLVHKCYQPRKDIPSEFESIPKGHSAVELDRAGVNFRPHEDNNWPMAMKLKLPRFSWFPLFWFKPTLKMPVVCIDDFTELVLRNLIIYEHSSEVPNYVTAYACAMDMLIDTPEDVAMLVNSEVLVNDLGSNEKAADMINNICKEVPIVDFFYSQQWKHMDSYYNGYWPNIIAVLRRKYFSSPWNIIALFAGTILFVLTVVQTIYGIKAA